MDGIPKIGTIGGLEEIPGIKPGRKTENMGDRFSETLKSAIARVDGLQKESESAQIAYSNGGDVELHDVLIKLEEAEVAFKTMMEVRNRLVEAYQNIMKMQ